ncbi:MAG: Na+/H+ antiporter NhaA [Actinomycetota bacterium]|nr:Na+/H+ antiporter NhaA [Actinomycetota bacterium]
MPARKIKRKVVDPVADFLRAETAGGFALLAGAAVALLWVNVVSASGYESLWGTQLRIGIGDVALDEDLRHWVNDGLMVIFFFLISLEIKRELVVGDLREPRAAALPIVAAVGGVLVPVAIFFALAGGGDTADGWGIPMATDAAFALGVLAILGDRVGVGVKLFLVTIAVADDVMAILVIAVAYAGDLSAGWILATVVGVASVVALRRLGVTSVLAYVPVGIAIWIAMLESGVHATLAGVALGLLTPAKPVGGRKVLEELEDRVHPLSSFVVLPLFALANAGVELGGSALLEPDAHQVALAVAVGLVAGKFMGIAGATILALRLRLGTLPEGVDLRGVLGAAALGGIGFTVSLFIAPLAYSDDTLVEGAKVGILAGSVLSAAAGVAILAPGGRHPTRRE